MKIEQLSEHIGAEISDVDLGNLGSDEITEIKSAWLDHKVLVFRDQYIINFTQNSSKSTIFAIFS